MISGAIWDPIQRYSMNELYVRLHSSLWIPAARVTRAASWYVVPCTHMVPCGASSLPSRGGAIVAALPVVLSGRAASCAKNLRIWEMACIHIVSLLAVLLELRICSSESYVSICGCMGESWSLSHIQTAHIVR